MPPSSQHDTPTSREPDAYQQFDQLSMWFCAPLETADDPSPRLEEPPNTLAIYLSQSYSSVTASANISS